MSLSGRLFYLGKHGSDESRAEYDRLLSEWIAGRRSAAPVRLFDLTIAEVVSRYWKQQAESYYRKPTGRTLPDGSAESVPTSELGCIADACKPLLRLYGHTQANAFGPVALRGLRDEMIRLGWCRKSINRHIGRIRRLFRWAESHELVAKGLAEHLATVDGLRAGRSAAKETKPVQPIGEDHARAIIPFVAREVGAMIELQLLTGMRPGEVCTMRGCDIDTSGREVWVYTPATHKTAHHGHARTIFIGPKARAVLESFLKPDLTAYFFSPAEAERRRREELTRTRTTPAELGNVPGRNRRRSPRKTPGEHYTPHSYARAIKYGCRVAFPAPGRVQFELRVREIVARDKTTRQLARQRAIVESSALVKAIREHDRAHAFHPHQLRHTAATKIREGFGVEAAQVILGHATLSATQVYAEKNAAAGRAIAGRIG